MDPPKNNAMMHFVEAGLVALTLHKIGNKSADEGMVLSDKLLEVSEIVKPLLLQ